MTMENDRVAQATDGVDCHIHLFGNSEIYPVTGDKTYTPTVTTFDQWQDVSELYGIRRAVLVQPSVYGIDNRRLVEGLQQAGQRARGVAVIDDTVPNSQLESMHAAGVRGVRLNFATGFSSDTTAALQGLKSTAKRAAHFGWHIQVLARGDLLGAVVDIVPSLPVTVIFDHMAGAHIQSYRDARGFQSALRLLRSGGCWIKVSGADHVASRRDTPEDALPIIRMLVDANPDQLVWGSDWPHVGKAKGPGSVEYLPIDHKSLLQLLYEAAGPEAGKRILQDNPTKFYDWS